MSFHCKNTLWIIFDPLQHCIELLFHICVLLQHSSIVLPKTMWGFAAFGILFDFKLNVFYYNIYIYTDIQNAIKMTSMVTLVSYLWTKPQQYIYRWLQSGTFSVKTKWTRKKRLPAKVKPPTVFPHSGPACPPTHLPSVNKSKAASKQPTLAASAECRIGCGRHEMACCWWDWSYLLSSGTITPQYLQQPSLKGQHGERWRIEPRGRRRERKDGDPRPWAGPFHSSTCSSFQPNERKNESGTIGMRRNS